MYMQHLLFREQLSILHPPTKHTRHFLYDSHNKSDYFPTEYYNIHLCNWDTMYSVRYKWLFKYNYENLGFQMVTCFTLPLPVSYSFCLWQCYNYKQQAALHLLTSCRLQNNTMLQLIKTNDNHCRIRGCHEHH